MKGVIYARYSEGPRQTDQSIEGQVADCRAFAAEKEIDIVEIYADRHVSGKSVDGRDEFQRMMRDADRRLFDCVIVWKVDRFGRNREDIAVNKIRLRKNGVTLMYARESIPEGPEGILLESLMEGLAEYYSADLRQKVERGMRESAKKGKWPSQVPIGYKKDAERHIVIDKETAPAIRAIYRMYLEGSQVEELRDYLYTHGVVGRKGMRPSQNMVYKILRNRKYMGEFRYRDIDVPAEPIVDEGTFERVQDLHHGPERNAAGTAKADYLLSCKCHCGYCGKVLNGSTGTGRHGGKYSYYVCGRTRHGEKCQLRPRRREELEDIVIRKTMQDVLTDEVIDQVTSRIMYIQSEEAKQDPTAGYRDRLADIKKRQDNLVLAMEKTDSEAIPRRLQALAEEQRELEIEIAKAEIRRPVIPESYIRDWLRSFRDGDKDDPAFRRRIVDTFVADVAVMNDELTIFYNISKKEGSREPSLVDYRQSCANPEGLSVWGGWIVLRTAV